METTPTPRDVRRRLNQIERYVERHADAFGPRVVYLRSLIEVAVTAEHVDFLADEVRTTLASPT